MSPVLPLLFVLATGLAACEQHFDSIAKLNDIPFGGTNEANIAAMVVNPTDLQHGRGINAVDGATAAPPVQRLLTDHPKTLVRPGQMGGGGNGGGSGG